MFLADEALALSFVWKHEGVVVPTVLYRVRLPKQRYYDSPKLSGAHTSKQERGHDTTTVQCVVVLCSCEMKRCRQVVLLEWTKRTQRGIFLCGSQQGSQLGAKQGVQSRADTWTHGKRSITTRGEHLHEANIQPSASLDDGP